MSSTALNLAVMCSLLMHYFMTTLGEDKLYNVELYKPAYQSSVYVNWFAYNGNDGRMSGFVDNNDCIHTLDEAINWWMVDLLDLYVINSIILTNRNDNSVVAARLHSFLIDVFTKDPRLVSTFPSVFGDICYNQTAAATIGTFTWNCSKPLVGRFVRLIRYNNNFLNFCELQVMASLGSTHISQFKIYVNRKLNMTSLLELTVSSRVTCGSQCLEKRYKDGCTAFNWFHSTRLCQLLNVDPRNSTLLSTLVSVADVQFFITI